MNLRILTSLVVLCASSLAYAAGEPGEAEMKQEVSAVQEFAKQQVAKLNQKIIDDYKYNETDPVGVALSKLKYNESGHGLMDRRHYEHNIRILKEDSTKEAMQAVTDGIVDAIKSDIENNAPEGADLNQLIIDIKKGLFSVTYDRIYTDNVGKLDMAKQGKIYRVS